jgi:probable F420-dependent oxidoreductase
MFYRRPRADMRFSYTEAMCDPAFYAPLARAAEEAGYSTFLVPDSVCYPRDSDSKYPYTESGEREFLENKPFLDPFTLIPALGAVTERLRFATFVLKLPIRSPVLVAKSATSTAVLTGERLSLGVGTSPWPEDFRVTFQEWETRGKRMDEMIEIIRGLTAGDFYEFHGHYYDLPPIKLCPVPKSPIPILIGGHSEAALRRAARVGDGWMFAGGSTEDLSRCIERLKTFRRECGRESMPFEIHASSLHAYQLDGVRQLEDLGVTDLVVGFRNPYTRAADEQPLASKIALLQSYAVNIISKH